MSTRFSIFQSIFLLFCLSCSTDRLPVDYVNPFIGTDGNGHSPGVMLPLGMVQLSPLTCIKGCLDGCSGYHYGDSLLYGFSHTRLSSAGGSDYGDVLFMPTVETKPLLQNHQYAATFRQKNEKALAGYYAVTLNNGVHVELTVTTRVGLHQYAFPNKGQANIILDLAHRDKTLESSLQVVSPTQIEGMRRSQAKAKDQYIYFVAEFSKPFVHYGAEVNRQAVQDFKETLNAADIKAWFTFAPEKGEPILMKVGISTVSIAGARKNLEQELSDWDFKKTREIAIAKWNSELSKIKVKTEKKDMYITFYTALYHTMLQPNVNMDVDGQYRGGDNQIHQVTGFTNYSVASLWEAFRTGQPLYTIINRQRTNDFIQSFLTQYDQKIHLPVLESAADETDFLTDYHAAVSMIADAATKGIKDYNLPAALLEAMKTGTTSNHLDLPAYISQGYIGQEDDYENVSKTLEYAYDDWCVGQIAQLLNKPEDYDTYKKRSENWRNLYDTETDFIRPRKNGGWALPFDPNQIDYNYMEEGNAWQCSFFVLQNIPGLIQAMGGKEAFEKKLDDFFSTDRAKTDDSQSNTPSLIGQYIHGNKQSHHIPYLYNYADKPYKAQALLRHILQEFYKPSPNGLIGNDNGGKMSFWYVLSALGIYQTTPGSPRFELGIPLFSKAEWTLENGKKFIIQADAMNEKGNYVQSVALNGVNYTKHNISYEDIMNGGTLSFTLGEQPNKNLYDKDNTVPEIIPAVLTPIQKAAQTFEKSLSIVIENNAQPNCTIYYTEDGSAPTTASKRYENPFTIHKNTLVRAIAANEAGHLSGESIGRYYRLPHPGWKIQLKSGSYPNNNVTDRQEEMLIDGIRGRLNWRKGEWQCVQGKVFDAVINMGSEKPVSIFSAEFLQDTEKSIIMPSRIEFYTSTDNQLFELAGTVANTLPAKDYNPHIQELTLKTKPILARYVKIKAYPFGKLPEWHRSRGEQSFTFIDEINIQ